ncbi:hypothetical protein [Cylindrospermopsis raciborskii]|uniref:hypothetical protein n=3 Tax=Cylindrospermopsis raciborskii TaxID=77022 RepID=UPI00402B6AAF
MLGGMMEGQAPDPYRASTFYRLKTLDLHFVHKQSKDFLFPTINIYDSLAKDYNTKSQEYVTKFEEKVFEFMSLEPKLPEPNYSKAPKLVELEESLLSAKIVKTPGMEEIIKISESVLEVGKKTEDILKEALREEANLNFKEEFINRIKEDNNNIKSLKAYLDVLENNFSTNFSVINTSLVNLNKLTTSVSLNKINKKQAVEKLVYLYDNITNSLEFLKKRFLENRENRKELMSYMQVFELYEKQEDSGKIRKHPLSEKYYDDIQNFVLLHRKIDLLNNEIEKLINLEKESYKKVKSVDLHITSLIPKVSEEKTLYETYKAKGNLEGVYTSPLEFTLNFLTAYSKFSERTLPSIIDNNAGLRAPIAEDAIYNYVLGNFGPATQLVQEMAAIKTIVSGYSQHSSLDSIEGISNRRRLLEERILRDLQLDPEKKKLLEKEFTLITEQFARKLAVTPSVTREQVESEINKEIPSIRKQVKKELRSGKHVGQNWYGFNIISRLNSIMMSNTPETINKIVDRIVKEKIRIKYDDRIGVIDKTKDKFLGTKSQRSFLKDVIEQRRNNLIAINKDFMPSEYYSSFFETLFNKIFGYHTTVKDFEDSFATRLSHPELVNSQLTEDLIRESGVYEFYQKDLEDRIKSAQVSDPASEYLHEGMELVRRLSFNLKQSNLDPVQRQRGKSLYENITKTQRIVLPQLLVLDEDFKQGTYTVTYGATDKYKPAEGLLLGLDIMQKLSLVFQTQSSKALLIQMQLAFELQSSFGLLAKITKQEEEGSAVIISAEEYDQYQNLVALLGSTLTETFDLLRNQETIRQAGGERFKVTGISSIAMSTLLAAEDEIVAGSRFFQVAREGTDSVISSKRAQRRLKNINELYEKDSNKALQLINKLRALYLSQNNIIDSREITIEHLDKIRTLQPKTDEEYNKLDGKQKRELNTRIEDYLLRLVLEKEDFSSVKVDPSSKINTLEDRREKNLKKISLGQQIRATMIRQGAPFGSSWRSRTGHVLKRVLSDRKLIERGKKTGTYIVPDEKAIGNNTLGLDLRKKE